MEILSCCSGRAWRSTVRAENSDVRAWVDRLRVEAGYGSAVWREEADGAWMLAGSPEYASNGDPLAAVEIRGQSGHVLVDGRLGERITTLSNISSQRPSDPGWPCGDLVRVASSRETVARAALDARLGPSRVRGARQVRVLESSDDNDRLRRR